ncbi:membrane protein [Pseudohongiella nitratireducens]|jgi:putative membrane protein|uniref:Membrane protein n=1 Tax=Pseudohongiella nitratireducens TaxID=1768907 RepID=A0A916QJW4_9GAMM|nr:DUF2214 family protein [Pseudohongiella nitratireducens]GFZ78057.1 membrane protein [Pseudohongiella nitratireducens]
MPEAIISSFHLLSVLAMFIGTLIVLPAASAEFDRQSAAQLLKVYYLKLACLLFALASGLTLWLAIGKPAEFYSNNAVFHAKLGIFMLFALLLVVQIVTIRRCMLCSSLPAQLPRWLGWVQKIALAIFLAIPPLAYLMARGIGYSG